MAKSVNLDFFAAEADQRALLDFLFSSTDVRVFESYSEFDADLREFRSTEELGVTFPIGTDEHGNGFAVLLQLWSPSVMSKLTITRFTLDPSACDGHTFRHRIDGGGLMQLYLGGVCGRVVTKSHFGHQSQIRAQKWDLDCGINWAALRQISNRIQYHIRKRLAAGKVPGCPVLSQAFELARAGYALKLAAQTPWQFELQSESK
jgi:hypothetical protein